MAFIIFIATVIVVKLLSGALGFTYNIFVDPFELKLVLFDFALWILVYGILLLVYRLGKRVFIRGSSV